MSSSVSAVGPRPHNAPSPESDTRSLPSVTFARRQPSFSSPTISPAGMRTPSRNTSLNMAGPAICLVGRPVMARGGQWTAKDEVPRGFSGGGVGGGRHRRPPTGGDGGGRGGRRAGGAGGRAAGPRRGGPPPRGEEEALLGGGSPRRCRRGRRRD